MKRTRKNETAERHDQFIERKIIIGLITDSEYAGKTIKSLDDMSLHRLLSARSAKMIAGWCVDYYNQYQKSPGKEIEAIFMQHQKKLNTEVAGDIEDILHGLSEEYENKPLSPYLYDQTINYFRHRQGQLLNEDLQAALAADDIDSFCKLQTTFKLIKKDSDEKKILSAMDVINTEDKPTQWLVQDLLPKGLTVFGGQSKLGKSYLTLYTAIHLAQGKLLFEDDSFLAYKPVERRGPVLYLALEDSISRIKDRILKIDPEYNKTLLVQYFKLSFQWNHLHKGGLTDLEDWLKQNKKARLVVIDVLATVWNMSTKTGAGRWYNEEYGIYGPVEEVQKTTARQSIADYLRLMGPMKFREIEQAVRDGEIEIKISSLPTVLKKMVRDGSLQQPDGNYVKYTVAGYSDQFVRIKK